MQLVRKCTGAGYCTSHHGCARSCVGAVGSPHASPRRARAEDLRPLHRGRADAGSDPKRGHDAQDELLRAFNGGELERDVVCVVRWQGPQANGMPELHKLTPPLAVLQGRGFCVALVTDGRMSGASGKVPAAIHVSPEAAAGGPLAKLRDGDIVRVDADAGTLQALVPAEEWAARETAAMPENLKTANGIGVGREMFAAFRRNALLAEEGACTWL